MGKGMAEVLAEHQQKVGIRDMRSHCWCGWAGEMTGRAFVEHQAAALTAAGYGLVADAKREAWDEGIAFVMRRHGIGRLVAPNPYRKASNDDQ